MLRPHRRALLKTDESPPLPINDAGKLTEAREKWLDALMLMLLTIAIALVLSTWAQDRKREKWLALHGLENLQEYVCTDDCKLFYVGAQWAEEQSDGSDCPHRKSVAFYQGCLAMVAFNAELGDLERRAALAEAEVKATLLEPTDPSFMGARRRKRWESEP